jgi:hypothetical protein
MNGDRIQEFLLGRVETELGISNKHYKEIAANDDQKG